MKNPNGPDRDGMRTVEPDNAEKSPPIINPTSAETTKLFAPSPLQRFLSLAALPADQDLPICSKIIPQGLRYDVRSLRNHPIVRDNLPITAIVVAYILAVYAVHALFGIQNKLVLEFYYDWFARLAVVFSGLFFLLLILKGNYRQYLTANSVVGFLVVFLLAPLFKSAFASFKQIIPHVNNFAWDYGLMRLDYVLHFGHHPWKLLEPILSYPYMLRATDLLYALWFVFLFLSCLWMAWSKNRRLRLCFFVSTLLVWIFLGSCLAAIFSSAGPCYYSRVLPSAQNPFAPLISKLDEIHHAGMLYSVTNQFFLWEAKLYDTWLPFGGISAMPSIHLAMATIFALLAFNVRKWLGWIFVGYGVLIQIGSVILGWHYAVDGYVGILLTLLIWFTVARFVKRPA